MGERKDERTFGRTREAERLRLLLRRELRHMPQHLLAPIIGISRSSLRKFLALSEPTRETRRRLREWAMDRPEPHVPLGVIGLAVLAGEFPAPKRLWARRRLLQVLYQLHIELDQQPPGWIIEEAKDTETELPG